MTVIVGVSACGGNDSSSAAAPIPDRPSAAAPSRSATADPPSAAEPTSGRTDVTTLRISFAGQVLTADLADTSTTRDLLDQLPLTLRFRDLNGVEKIAKLPRALSTDGVPPGADPDVADLGYYAPSGDLVLYYGDVGYWDGIVRLGRLDGNLDLLERQPDGFVATLERA